MPLSLQTGSTSLVPGYLRDRRARSAMVEEKCNEALRVIGAGHAEAAARRDVGGHQFANETWGRADPRQEMESSRECRPARQVPTRQRSRGDRLVHGERS